MAYKKTTLIVLLVSMMPHLSISSQSELKTAISTASRKAFWKWAKARSLPVGAGAVMCIVPPCVMVAGGLGTIGNSGTGMTKTKENVFAAMMVGGTLISYVSVPVGTLLMYRQVSLISRDLHLVHKFTKSTARLTAASLPNVATIRAMKNHHQLLSVARQYFDDEGNWVERRLLTTPGLRGYKNVQHHDAVNGSNSNLM